MKRTVTIWRGAHYWVLRSFSGDDLVTRYHVSISVEEVGCDVAEMFPGTHVLAMCDDNEPHTGFEIAR